MTCISCGAARPVMVVESIRIGRVLRTWASCVKCWVENERRVHADDAKEHA